MASLPMVASGGEIDLTLLEVLNTQTSTNNGTQVVTMTLSHTPEYGGKMWVTNSQGNRLILTENTGFDIDTENVSTDNNTYWTGTLSNFTSSTISIKVNHNRASVNQAAKITLVYM